MKSKYSYIKKIFFIFMALFQLSGCRDTGGVLEGFSVLGPQKIAVSTQSQSTWTGFCHELEMTFLTGDDVSAISSKERTVDFSTDIGAIYADSACTQPLASSLFDIDDSNLAFYFRASSLGSSQLTLSTSGLTDGNLTMNAITPSAQLVLGQSQFNQNLVNAGNGINSSASTLANPASIAIAGGKLFVADYSNHRVLIWNTIPTNNGQAADLVLGQADLTSEDCNRGGVVAANTLCGPYYVHSDGTKLVIADEINSRVLIWNTLPTTNGQAADVVLGQPDMMSDTSNNGGVSATTLSFPSGVFIANSKLFVADSANNRVLIWNSIPTVNQTAADVVVGQAAMGLDTANTSINTMSYPYMVSVYNGKMFVSDFSNNRILIWNSIPTTNGANASAVIGQPDFDTGTPNTGGIGASTLQDVGGAVVDDNGRLYISDYRNHRILVWNSVPTANGQNADVVIGQANFITNTDNFGGVSASSVYGPWGTTFYNGSLWVAEYDNHRILKYEIPDMTN